MTLLDQTLQMNIVKKVFLRNSFFKGNLLTLNKHWVSIVPIPVAISVFGQAQIDILCHSLILEKSGKVVLLELSLGRHHDCTWIDGLTSCQGIVLVSSSVNDFDTVDTIQ